ncbi:MAG: DUF1598 domain-containing protein, partial [Planctomycetia bacterium]
QNPDATLVAMQDAMGPQRVTVGGVPGDSRFARVLVAADYRMKRVGMGLEPAGIAEVPSYLSMEPPGATAAANASRLSSSTRTGTTSVWPGRRMRWPSMRPATSWPPAAAGRCFNSRT